MILCLYFILFCPTHFVVIILFYSAKTHTLSHLTPPPPKRVNQEQISLLSYTRFAFLDFFGLEYD